MLATMEAEHELPPVLQIALEQNSLAREGWQLMSRLHRRRHLLGIFYYQTPDARACRIAKAMEEAALFAQRRKLKNKLGTMSGKEFSAALCDPPCPMC